MAEDSGTAAGTPAPRQRQRKTKSEGFLIEIVDWKVCYALAARRDTPADSQYEFLLQEHETIEISARLMAPERFVDRTIAIELSNLPILDKTLGQGSDAYSKRPLGSLSIRGERNRMSVHMPAATIWGLIATLAAEKLPFIEVEGEHVGQGAYQVMSLVLGHHYEPGDYGLC